jgi:hypothetical protein
MTAQAGGGRKWPVFLDFWVASYLGQGGAWIRRAVGMPTRKADRPALCRRVAYGDPVPASSLLVARGFSFGVWWTAAMSCAIALFAIAVIGARFGVWHARSPGHAGASDTLAAVGALLAAAAGQGAVQIVRLAALVLYSRRAYAQPDAVLSRSASLGVPRRYDFWLSVPAALIMLVAILQPG